MIKKIISFFAIVCVVFSCNISSKNNPTTDTDVATTFIRATLDNDFKTANKYLLDDGLNRQFFETFCRRGGVSSNKAEQEKYKAANIIINSLTPINDSTTIVKYTNSYKINDSTKIKLVRTAGQWLVDLKYTFTEN